MNYIDAAIVRYADLIDLETLDTIREDAWKRIGKDQRGQKCGRGWQGLKGACERSKDGDTDAAVKRSRQNLAAKIRKEKGLDPKSVVTAKRLGALDDRIEKAQKSNTARKSATTKARSAGGGVERRPSIKGKKSTPEPLSLNSQRILNNNINAYIGQGSGFTDGIGDGPSQRRKERVIAAAEKGDRESLGNLARELWYKSAGGENFREFKTVKAYQAAFVDHAIEQFAPKIKVEAPLTPQNTNLLDPKQSTAFFNQGAAIAKAEGRTTDQKKWEKEAKKASSTAMKVAQQKAATVQPGLFGIEEVSSDLPLFAKRDAWKSLGGQKGQPCDKKRGWEGLKGACKRAKKGASEDDRAALAKQSKVDLAGKIKARKLAAAAAPADNVLPFKRKAQDIALDRVKSKTSLAELDPNTIEVDPKRFQYKIVGEHTASGEVGSLSGVRKYDPNLSGILQVWKDPVDDKTYVVNGHNRLALAKRLGADAVAVRYLDAPDAKTARSIGALTNIAEGRGDALDAAKFFRDTGISKQDLDAKGIPMREKIATDGLALSKLDDSLFRKTIDGDLSIARAAIIGGSGLEPSQQRDLSKLIDTEGKRRNLTDGAIQEMVDIAKSSNTYQEQTMSLFGAEEVSKSNMIEKAKLQAAIKKRLSREKNLFGAVSRGTAAKDLARGGNQINAEQSGAISNQAQQALNVFDQMKNLAGPISQAINAAADRVAAGENPRIVEKNLYESILESEFISGSKIKAA